MIKDTKKKIYKLLMKDNKKNSAIFFGEILNGFYYEVYTEITEENGKIVINEYQRGNKYFIFTHQNEELVYIVFYLMLEVARQYRTTSTERRKYFNSTDMIEEIIKSYETNFTDGNFRLAYFDEDDVTMRYKLITKSPKELELARVYTAANNVNLLGGIYTYNKEDSADIKSGAIVMMHMNYELYLIYQEVKYLKSLGFELGDFEKYIPYVDEGCRGGYQRLIDSGEIIL